MSVSNWKHRRRRMKVNPSRPGRDPGKLRSRRAKRAAKQARRAARG